MRIVWGLVFVAACGGKVPGNQGIDAGTDAPLPVPDAAPFPDDGLLPIPDATPPVTDAAGCLKAAADTLYVDGSAAAGGNGSQGCPFQRITDALDAARLLTLPVTIIVEAGTYSDEAFPLDVFEGVTLEGDPSGTSRDQFTIDGSGPSPDGTFRATAFLEGEIDYMKLTDSSGAADYILVSAVGQPTLALTTIAGGS
jgi:hypothetical protein